LQLIKFQLLQQLTEIFTNNSGKKTHLQIFVDKSGSSSAADWSVGVGAAIQLAECCASW